MRRNLFLELRGDLGKRPHLSDLFTAPEANINPAVPKPSDVSMDFGIVYFLKFVFEAVRWGCRARRLIGPTAGW